MNTNTHPIELFIVLILDMIEGLCWIINELTGGHETPPKPLGRQVTLALPAIQPLFTDLHSLTVKQLQAMVGTKNSRYRKADLIQMAIAY